MIRERDFDVFGESHQRQMEGAKFLEFKQMTDGNRPNTLPHNDRIQNSDALFLRRANQNGNNNYFRSHIVLTIIIIITTSDRSIFNNSLVSSIIHNHSTRDDSRSNSSLHRCQGWKKTSIDRILVADDRAARPRIPRRSTFA